MPRVLTPAAKAQLFYFSDDNSDFTLGCAHVLFLLIAVLMATTSDIGFTGTAVLYAMAAGILLGFRKLVTSPMHRVYEVYKHGHEIPISLVSITETTPPPNHRVRNPVRTWEIVVRKPDGLLRIKTKKPEVVDAFSPSQQLAYTYAKYAKTLVPLRALSLDYYNPQQVDELRDAPTTSI
jgi:hypothetical protein